MLLTLKTQPSVGQCAMCKATVENSKTGEQTAFEQRARGLNTGILYLMCIPYLLAAVIGYYWYSHSKKESERKKQVSRIIKSKLS